MGMGYGGAKASVLSWDFAMTMPTFVAFVEACFEILPKLRQYQASELVPDELKDDPAVLAEWVKLEQAVIDDKLANYRKQWDARTTTAMSDDLLADMLFPIANKAEYSWEGLAEELALEDDEDRESYVRPVERAWLAFECEFIAKYKPASVGLCSHASDEQGDRYDQVSGAFLNVEGHLVWHPNAEPLRDHIDTAFYVIFG